MTDRTRRLLALLGDPVVGRILTACDTDERSELELRAVTGASHATLVARLNELVFVGLLDEREARVAKPAAKAPRGRPSTVWRVASRPELATFESQADTLTIALADAVARRTEVEAQNTRRVSVEEAAPTKRTATEDRE